jgi:hypothetical protein
VGIAQDALAHAQHERAVAADQLGEGPLIALHGEAV